MERATAYPRGLIGPTVGVCGHLGKMSCEVSVAQGSRQSDTAFESTEHSLHVWHRVNKTADGRTAHQADRPLGINTTGTIWEKLPHHPPSTVHHRQPTCRADASNLLRGVRSAVRWPCPNQPGEDERACHRPPYQYFGSTNFLVPPPWEGNALFYNKWIEREGQIRRCTGLFFFSATTYKMIDVQYKGRAMQYVQCCDQPYYYVLSPSARSAEGVGYQ
jgi:hypothetical protein